MVENIGDKRNYSKPYNESSIDPTGFIGLFYSVYMKKSESQTSIFDNIVRVDPLKQKEIKSIRVDLDKPKEFLTNSGRVVVVVKKHEFIQGVGGGKTMYYQINDGGKVIQPLKSIGVKNYLKRN